jgi:biopolymer transport protein ExbD
MAAKLGGGGGGRFDLGQNSDINVTPFVDVMLVLLIIFMVAIPAATVSIKLDLPPAIPPPPGAKIEQPVLINIQRGGTVFIGDRATNMDSLISDLSGVLSAKDPSKAPTDQRVYIRADKSVRYGDFMAVMNMLQGNGFYQVALINEELT